MSRIEVNINEDIDLEQNDIKDTNDAWIASNLLSSHL